MKRPITIKEYLDKYGKLYINEDGMFKFWSDPNKKMIGGKFIKGKPMF